MSCLRGEAQDHLLALGVGDHALEDAVEDEELLHLVGALVHQQVALAVVGDRQQRLELVPLRAAVMPSQDEVAACSCRRTRVALRDGWRWTVMLESWREALGSRDRTAIVDT